MICLGLIGKPLKHSFSAKYFSQKFLDLGLEKRYEYHLYPLDNIEDFTEFLNSETRIKGLNVTIPYKKSILPFCTWHSPEVIEIGAANTLKITRDFYGIVRGIDAYNTDVLAFSEILKVFIAGEKNIKALVLGNGGSSASVQYSLAKQNIDFKIVSRSAEENCISYADVNSEIIADHKLIINTTPLGMYPDVQASPDIPYSEITSDHFLFDLIYNPEQTQFLEKGSAQGAKTRNGLDMLYLQADKAWEIWNS